MAAFSVELWEAGQESIGGKHPRADRTPQRQQCLHFPIGWRPGESPTVVPVSGGSSVHRCSESHVKSGTEVHEGGVRGTA